VLLIISSTLYRPHSVKHSSLSDTIYHIGQSALLPSAHLCSVKHSKCHFGIVSFASLLDTVSAILSSSHLYSVKHSKCHFGIVSFASLLDTIYQMRQSATLSSSTFPVTQFARTQYTIWNKVALIINAVLSSSTPFIFCQTQWDTVPLCYRPHSLSNIVRHSKPNEVRRPWRTH
jgi:hypothetical protein